MKKSAIFYGFLCLILTILSIDLLYNKTIGRTLIYPIKPITMIVPFSAGGSLDMVARNMEKYATKYIGQPLITTNITGKSGTIGWNELATAKTNGHTIGMVTNSILMQPLYAETRYYYPSTIEPLCQIAISPVTIAVSSDSPWNNLKDLLAYAKNHPGQIKYGTAGLGTVSHVTAEMLIGAADVKLTHLPFLGESEALAALLGGRVHLVFMYPYGIIEYVRAGKTRLLGLSSEKRLISPIFKDIPTFKEQGLDVVFNTWIGIGAPKGLPAEIKNNLTSGLDKIVHDPEFRKTIVNLGLIFEYLGPEEFSQKWNNENNRLTKIATETGIAEKIAAQKNKYILQSD